MFQGVPGDSDTFGQVCQESANVRGAEAKQGNYSPSGRLQGCARDSHADFCLPSEEEIKVE